ncbi:hypothetical protein V9L05_03695 [Bernardetia sp. Wsw4-3y2]|uniref:hypothetical protein n=1 Tax=Bernardetia sp. Wsw4-3y2 TaxID=3127471 RepID=UPI0030CAFA6C
MKTNIEPLQTECFYHIYNRGINGETIFKEERNYSFFLQKYAQFVSPFVTTYSYCLLRNHFHLLICTNSEEEIRLELQKLGKKPKKEDISWILSNAFASFFKSYSQAINKSHQRTGRLFEEPFRRIHVDNDAYFTTMIEYIHKNPQKHGFVKDFREYEHSSYHSHILEGKTKLEREEVLSWFGSKEEYQKFHQSENKIKDADKFKIEFD